MKPGNFYRPQTKLAKVGFHRWGSLSRGVSVQWGLCPGGLCLGGLCLGVSLQGGLCPGEVSVQGGLCPRGVCPEGSLSGGSLPGVSLSGVSLSMGGLCLEDPPYGNEQAVCILLEYILVAFVHTRCARDFIQTLSFTVPYSHIVHVFS